jgi:hypothetical protein
MSINWYHTPNVQTMWNWHTILWHLFGIHEVPVKMMYNIRYHFWNVKLTCNSYTYLVYFENLKKRHEIDMKLIFITQQCFNIIPDKNHDIYRSRKLDLSYCSNQVTNECYKSSLKQIYSLFLLNNNIKCSRME